MPGNERYHFGFGWETPYGHAVRLVEGAAPVGSVVIDLGCGYGPAAETLQRLGFVYVGVDIDHTRLDDLEARGFSGHHADLNDVDALPALLTRAADERTVGAVLLLDTLEHLVDTDGFLSGLARASDVLHDPALVVSIPNTGHFDLGAKLLAGRWDVTPTGLLDETHLRFFTEHSLERVLATHGWQETARADIDLPHSDQYFPETLPTLADHTTIGQLLRVVRDAADPYASVNQFVRSYTRGAPVTRGQDARFAAVVLDGAPEPVLVETLTCVAGQATREVEVVVVTPNEARVRRILEQFSPSFATAVDVVDGHAAAVASTTAPYLAFVGPGELPTGDWIEQFLEHAATAPGTAMRAGWVERGVRVGRVEPYEVVGPLAPGSRAPFDPLFHAVGTPPPLASVAVPRGLPVLERLWPTIAYATVLAGLREIPAVTSVRLHGPGFEHPDPTGEIRDALARVPVVLPAGAAPRIVGLLDAAADREHQLHELRASTSWRVTGPLRALSDAAHRRLRRG